MRLTARSDENVALVEAYAKANGFWRHDDAADPVFTDTLELDMSTVVPSLAGPKRPQDKVVLTEVDDVFQRRPRQGVQEGRSGARRGRRSWP